MCERRNLGNEQQNPENAIEYLHLIPPKQTSGEGAKRSRVRWSINGGHSFGGLLMV